MFVKFIAALVIIFCASRLGRFYAAKFTTREKVLGDFQDVLKIIEFEIYFLNSTVRETIKKIADGDVGNLTPLFCDIALCMASENCAFISPIWAKALKKYAKQLCLTQSDVKILIDFSNKLGAGDIKNEENNIKSTSLKLDKAQKEAAGDAAKNCKLFKNLGILSGVLIVILLI